MFDEVLQVVNEAWEDKFEPVSDEEESRIVRNGIDDLRRRLQNAIDTYGDGKFSDIVFTAHRSMFTDPQSSLSPVRQYIEGLLWDKPTEELGVLWDKVKSKTQGRIRLAMVDDILNNATGSQIMRLLTGEEF